MTTACRPSEIRGYDFADEKLVPQVLRGGSFAASLLVPTWPKQNVSADWRIGYGKVLAKIDAVTALEHSLEARYSSAREDETAMRQYVSALWAEDWDCPEDAVYDNW